MTTTNPARASATGRVHTVQGGGGVQLHVREWGRPDGPPVLLIHGWSQSLQCWRHQTVGELADQCRIVALDLRGHGMSERPPETAAYQDGDLWADDIAAAIDQLNLHRPVLVGWSYGGFVISDYLRAYGQETTAAVNFVGAAVLRNERSDHIGPSLLDNAPDACHPDPTVNIPAIRRLVRAFTVQPMSEDDWDTMLCASVTVPPEVRAALLARHIDTHDTLTGLTIPVLVSHGTHDTVVLPSMASHILSTCPSAVPSWYSNIGHAPFLESSHRFNSELLELVHRVNK